jgi:hypothetical protein
VEDGRYSRAKARGTHLSSSTRLRMILEEKSYGCAEMWVKPPHGRSRMLSPQVGETGSALAKPLTDHTNTLERVPVQLPKIFPVL